MFSKNSLFCFSPKEEHSDCSSDERVEQEEGKLDYYNAFVSAQKELQRKTNLSESKTAPNTEEALKK